MQKTNSMRTGERKYRVITFGSITLSAPGHQWFRLALCHTLHHSGTAKHYCCILRWCYNHNSVQGFSRAYNKKEVYTYTLKPLIQCYCSSWTSELLAMKWQFSLSRNFWFNPQHVNKDPVFSTKHSQ